MSETIETTSKKIRQISIRFTPSEIKQLKRAAQGEKLSLSEYVRRTVVRHLESKPGEVWDGKQWVKDNSDVSKEGYERFIRS